MYRDWRNFCDLCASLKNVACDLDDRSTISQESLNEALPMFITEVKKMDGTNFPGKTLYEILISVQFYLETLGYGWKLLNYAKFREVKLTLDNMIKLCTSQGVRIKVKKAQFLESK